MMLFGQLLNVKMTSMAGDSKKQSTAIPLKFRPVVPGGAGDAMAPPDYGRSFNPISTKGGDYAHQEILAPPDFQTFRRPWTTRRSLPKKDHQYDGKFLLGNAEMSISMFLREEPGAKFQRKSECFRKKSKCF